MLDLRGRAKHDAWDALDIGARTERNGRQGVRYTAEEGMTVMDPQTMREVKDQLDLGLCGEPGPFERGRTGGAVAA